MWLSGKVPGVIFTVLLVKRDVHISKEVDMPISEGSEKPQTSRSEPPVLHSRV